MNFVAIDDPIQNMDDINQYSVCDVLGNIRKQLIFSTHDINFLKFFIKKNEHKSGDIQVYMLKEPIISSSESYESTDVGIIANLSVPNAQGSQG